MRELFAKNSDTTLRGFIVWVPMLPSDTNESIPIPMPGTNDKRMNECWDSRKAIAKAFTPVLDLKTDAWDVYLIYPHGVRWDGDAPPKPSYWMHQLSKPESGAANKPFLDPKIFESKVRAELSVH